MRSVGVCSWSLKPESPEDLVSAARACGVSAVQLALDPIRRNDRGAWDEARTVEALRAGGCRILSGMMGMEGKDYSTLETIRATGGVRPGATWSANVAAARANADLARRLGIELVTFHAGFLPHAPDDPERSEMIVRLRDLADIFASRGVAIAFETGQESAETLVGVLKEIHRPSAGVNFDPANMILYGMGDPVRALSLLAPYVRQIHIKDATPTKTPGTWGTEVTAGTGAVDWKKFLAIVKELPEDVNLVIEREAGSSRRGDVAVARELLERHGFGANS